MAKQQTARLSWLTELQQHLLPCVELGGWAIGGSCLLRRLGLLSRHRDIDIVCTAQAVPQLQQRLQQSGWQLLPHAVHPQLQSAQFVRLQHPSGMVVELMAGIKVLQQGVERHWCFSPSRIEQHHQLPWMLLADWLTLYQLFQRPARVQLITAWLRQTRQG